MGRQRQRRISNLFWILTDAEEPRPSPEETDEVIRALEDPALDVRESLKYAVKILRRDTDRLNAALEESEEEREERRRKEREYRAEYRKRKRLSGKSEMSENGQSRTERTNRTEPDTPDMPDDSSAPGPSAPDVRGDTPTDAPTHTLTQTVGKPTVGARAGRGASAGPSGNKTTSSSNPSDEGEEDPPEMPPTYDAIYSSYNDAVDVAMFLTQDRKRADRKVFGALLRVLGDKAFRDILGAFFGEVKAGEVPRNRVAALLARLRAAERAAGNGERGTGNREEGIGKRD